MSDKTFKHGDACQHYAATWRKGTIHGKIQPGYHKPGYKPVPDLIGVIWAAQPHLIIYEPVEEIARDGEAPVWAPAPGNSECP